MPVAATAIARLDTPWWRARHEEKLARVRQGPVDLLWVGDSITQDWERTGPPEWQDFAPAWLHFYGDRNAVNLGFKGDNTAHLLWRLRHGEVDGISPKLAIVLIGANNLGRVHWTAPQTVVGIEAVVTELRQRLPHTHMLLLGVLPSDRSDYVTRTTTEINRKLGLRFAPGSGVTYMDLGYLFLHNGKLDRTQFFDDLLTPPDPPLHPTAAAQARLATAIEPVVARWMADRNKLTH